MAGINFKCVVDQYKIEETKLFPGNTLPALHYRQVLILPQLLKPVFIKKIFSGNDWDNSWQNSVFTYHHYHSITHEVLGFYKGRATLMLGGDNGSKVLVEAGDVLIIPAGVSHKNLDSEEDILCVGAYPDKMDYDMNYGKREERPLADRNIAKVPVPEKDPVFGLKHGLIDFWK